MRSMMFTAAFVVVWAWGVWAVRAEPIQPRSVSSAPAPQGVGAAVKVEAADYDFGTAWAGQAVTHTFTLTNTGRTPLAIRNVHATCGCTTTKDYAKTIAPGATWELPATLATQGQNGRVSKSIYVYVEAGNGDKVTLTSRPISLKAERGQGSGAAEGGTAKDAKHANAAEAAKSGSQGPPAGGAGASPARDGQAARPPAHGQDARATESVRFTFTGEIRTRFKFEPLRSVQFGRVKANDAETRSVTITSGLDAPLVLKNARVEEGPAPRFAGEGVGPRPPQTQDADRPQSFFVDLREVEKGKRYEVAVATVPPLREGMVQGRIHIETNVKEEPSIDLPVAAFVVPRLSVTPPTVSLPAVRTADTRQVVTFKNEGETPVHVKEVRASTPVIRTEFKPVFDGKLYQVTITVPKDLAIGEGSYSITIVTDDAEKPALPVMLRRAGWAGPTTMSTTRPVAALVGQKAPEFKLVTTADKPLSNKDIAGAVTVLNFVSPSCPHCKRQMPRLETLRAAYEPKGIRFVNVSQRMGSKAYSPEETASLFKQLGVTADLAVDADNAVGRAFRATSYPTLIVIGKTGTIEAVNSGNSQDLETRLKTQFDALLAGRSLSQTAAAPKAPNGRS